MRFFLIFLCSCYTAYAADLPDMGDSSDAILSPQMEKFIGQQFMRQLRLEVDIIEDRALNRYLQDLANQLLSYSTDPDADYHYFFIKDPSINAFAVLGGYIGVNIGLFLSTKSEDELASVLAHEISHITQRHSIRTIAGLSEISASEIASALLLVLGASTGNADATIAGLMTLGAGIQQRYINFTRAHEQEADRLGIDMLAKAQFNPQAMAQFFQQLQKKRRYYSNKDLAPAFLQSHPVTIDRIAEAQERAATYTNIETTDKHENHFALNRARLLVLNADYPEKLAKQLQKDLDNQRYNDPHALRYGLALAKIANDDLKGVNDLLVWLQSHGQDRILYHLLAIDLAIAQKDYQKAYQLAQQSLEDYPADYILTMRYAEILQQQKQPAQALTILKTIHKYQQKNIDYQRYLAKVLQANGNTTQALIAQAQTYFYQSRLKLAIKQLEQAQKLPSENYYIDSQITAYLKDWRVALEQQKRLKEEFE